MRRNLHLIGWFLFFHRLNFFSPIFVLYIIEVTGSYALAMSFLAIEKLTVLAAEIPTGILSDRIGRKHTASLGALCKLVGITLIAMSNSSGVGLSLMILGLIMTGIGFALFSGNNHALLYETLQNLNKSSMLHRFIGKKIDFSTHIGLFISCIVGGLVAHIYSFSFAIWMTVVPSTISLIISFFFTETQIKSKDGLKALAHLRRSFKKLGSNKNILKVFATDALESMHQAIYRMEVVFVETLVPLWGVGLYKGFVHLALATSFSYSGKIIEKLDYKRSSIEGFIIFSVVQVIAYIIATVISPFILIFSYLFKGYSQTATKIIIQHSLSNQERATMDSILSMSNSLLTSLMLILIGILIEYTSIPTAAIVFLVIRALLTVPLLISYFKGHVRHEA